MERIRVLLIAPMEPPRLVKIDHTAEELHRLVGGEIACTYPWADLVGLIYAEDAIALGYPLNRTLYDENGIPYDVVKGTFVIVGLGREDFCSISDDLAAKLTKRFRYPEMFLRTPDKHVICVRVGSDEPPIRLV